MLLTLVLEKTPEIPLDCKEFKTVNPKGKQSWLFFGRPDAEAETPIIWLTDAKNWFIGKDPEARKDFRWEEKGMTEEWDGWMASLTWWHEFEQDPGVGEGQRSLACYSPWGCKESDMTERLNWTYPMANASCNCHVSPARQGSPKPQHISLVSLHPCTEVTA